MKDELTYGDGVPSTVLAFDTATAAFSAAIVRNGARADAVANFAERNHSVRIVSEIKELLSRNGLKGEELDAIAVGQGPGSYTGVRIAVSAAKTLAWAWNIPLIGVSSLEAMALGAWRKLREESKTLADDREIWFVPILDARRGQVYTGRYAAGRSNDWRAVDADGIRLIDDWAGKIEAEGTQDADVAAIWFVGDVDVHAAAIEKAEQTGTRLRMMKYEMDATAVGLLGERKFRRGERSDVHGFVPNYTQLAEAEAKLLAASRGE